MNNETPKISYTGREWRVTITKNGFYTGSASFTRSEMAQEYVELKWGKRALKSLIPEFERIIKEIVNSPL